MLVAPDRINHNNQERDQQDSIARHLKQGLLFNSAIGFLLIGLIVALFGIKPLYDQLKFEQERSLNFAVTTRSMAIEQYLERSRDVAMQITSRTKARLKLEAYNRGEVNIKEFVNFSQGILTDAVNKSEEVVGLSRLDINKQAIISIGQTIPKSHWPIPHITSRKAILTGPVQINGQDYLIVGAPILDRKFQRVGTDIVLFTLNSLKKIIVDYKGLGNSGESLLAARKDGGMRLFFKQRNQTTESVASLSLKSDSTIAKALLEAFKGKLGIKSEQSDILSYGPVNNSHWGLVVRMDSKELYSKINRQLQYVAFSVLILIFLATLGITFMLRPLTGKVILHTGELERQIAEKTQALQNELRERKKAQNMLAEQKNELKRVNADLDQFAYIASHDLKAPLRAIANLSQWLAEDLQEKLDEDTQENMELLLGRVQRMENLIDGILKYSRAGRLSDDKEMVNTKELILEIWDSLSPPNGFSIDFSTDMPVFAAEKIRLYQVFANLISNGIKYHDQSSGKICVSAMDKGNAFEFIIADDGPGIELKFHDRIFRLFQTLRSRDEYESTGIGLTVVKKLVEEEGGTICLYSAQDEGAEFHFTWPK